jgi:hypothetical protein
MTISFYLADSPVTKLSDSDRRFLELTDDDIFRIGTEFMSYMNQKPNCIDGRFMLDEGQMSGFAELLHTKGYRWAFIIPVLLKGTAWTRKV